MASVHSVKAELAARYSLALFELADEKGQVPAVKEELTAVRQMIKDSKELRFMLSCPTITRAEKTSAVLASADKASFSRVTRDFLGTVAENNRLFALPDMIDSFFGLVDEREGVVEVEVVSPDELSDAKKEKLISVLASSLGKKTINLSVRKDASLLGGLTVRIGSLLVDNSLKTKIQQLKTIMKGA